MPPSARARAPASLATTIALPGGGRVHVVEVPQDLIDVTRCLVAVSETGASVAVSCAPRSPDLEPHQDP